MKDETILKLAAIIGCSTIGVALVLCGKADILLKIVRVVAGVAVVIYAIYCIVG